MQSLVRVSCSILAIEESYTDEFRLPPIIEEQRGWAKNFLDLF